MQSIVTIATTTTATDAATSGPAWDLILLVLSVVLTFLSALGVGIVIQYVRANDRSFDGMKKWFDERFTEIKQRLARGDKKFDDLYERTSDALVKTVMADGALRTEMARDFVSREEWSHTNERVAKIELDITRELTRLSQITETQAKTTQDLAETVARLGDRVKGEVPA